MQEQNPSLERRIAQFKNKLEQKVNLCDEEIERLVNDTNVLKTEMIRIKDEINILSIKENQEKSLKNGKKNVRSIPYEKQKLQTTIKYNKELIDIKMHHEQEINAIHDEFELQLFSIDKKTEENVGFINKSYENKSKEYQSILSKSGTSYSILGNSEKEYEFDDDSQQNLMKKLQISISKKQRERYDELANEKNRLNACISVLEEKDRDHIMNMERLNHILESMDQKYTDKLNRMRDQAHKEFSNLNRRMIDYQRKVDILMKKVQQSDDNHNNRMNGILMEKESLILQSSEKKTKTNESDSYNNSLRNLSNLKRSLDEKDQKLIELRKRNDFLVRELARIKHLNLRRNF